jgi:hypothetical protein
MRVTELVCFVSCALQVQGAPQLKFHQVTNEKIHAMDTATEKSKLERVQCQQSHWQQEKLENQEN